MLAFAANSLLNRGALAGHAIGPASFAAIRVAAGAAMLLGLLALRDRQLPRPMRPDWAAIIGLAAYALGFSFAYVALDAGLGALVLFGGVQVTMFAGAVHARENPPPASWIGMGLSLAGLVWLFWPSGHATLDTGGLTLMVLAAVGWGVYSLIGRRVTDPLRATAWNFAYVLPVALVAALVVADTQPATARGVLLAVISGGVTSGLGYALWYALLPRLGATVGALAQLSVPVIALAFGVLLLGENVTTRALVASALILGGIAVGVLWPRLGRGEHPYSSQR